MSVEERIIQNPVFGVDLKIFFKDEEPYFIGVNVARKLRIRRPDKAIKNIGEKHKIPLRELCKNLSETKKSEIFSKLSPLTIMIDEYAFFAVCLGSNIPEIEPFKEWVYEMIVSIRRERGVVPGLEGLSFERNPEKIIERTKEEIPEYEEDKKKRKAMNDQYKDGDKKSKNPLLQEGGRRLGLQFQENVREMNDFIREFNERSNRLINKS